MKIGIVCHNYPPARFEGGIAHYSRLLVHALVDRGHRVIVITCSEFTQLESPEDGKSVDVIRLPGPWNHKTLFAINRIAAKRALSVLVLQYSAASYSNSFRASWAMTRTICRKATAFHSLWGGFKDKLLAALLLIGNDSIIATNSEVMHLLEKYSPAVLNKTFWIPIGSNIRSVQKKRPPPDDRFPLIVYFGMLYPGKGLDMILDVLTELKARGRTFQFLFIGGGMLEHESYEAEFRRRISDRNLADIAGHTGLIPEKDVSLLLQKSRFVFLPFRAGLSDRRGSFMAAISHGKAVLTSPPCVQMPHIQNGMHAVWPDRVSPTSYADLAERLLDDLAFNRRVGRGARALYDQFDWPVMAEAYELALSVD